MKYTFNVKDDINLYQIKLLIIFLIQYLETKLPLEIDDAITKIPDEIKNQFKKV
jgi:NTP pyrophosphatase (non-canonical NTP hydrolase)